MVNIPPPSPLALTELILRFSEYIDRKPEYMKVCGQWPKGIKLALVACVNHSSFISLKYKVQGNRATKSKTQEEA